MDYEGGVLEMDMNMSNDSCSDSMGGMNMQFFFGFQCSLLFPNLNLSTPGEMLGGMVVVIVVSILYEGLKTLREILASLDGRTDTSNGHIQRRTPVKAQRKRNGHSGLTNSVKSQENTPLVAKREGQGLLHVLLKVLKDWLSPLHLVQSCLHVIQVGLAYLLMLVAMTYNGWLFLSVCVGAGLGYLVFGRCRRSLDAFRSQSEHCCN